MKRLPGQNWSASLVRRVPNLQGGAQYTIEGRNTDRMLMLPAVRDTTYGKIGITGKRTITMHR